jgi:hypothetical protein
MRETVYSELVREFFATFHFDLAEARTDMGVPPSILGWGRA